MRLAAWSQQLLALNANVSMLLLLFTTAASAGIRSEEYLANVPIVSDHVSLGICGTSIRIIDNGQHGRKIYITGF